MSAQKKMTEIKTDIESQLITLIDAEKNYDLTRLELIQMIVQDKILCFARRSPASQYFPVFHGSIERAMNNSQESFHLGFHSDFNPNRFDEPVDSEYSFSSIMVWRAQLDEYFPPKLLSASTGVAHVAGWGHKFVFANSKTAEILRILFAHFKSAPDAWVKKADLDNSEQALEKSIPKDQVADFFTIVEKHHDGGRYRIRRTKPVVD